MSTVSDIRREASSETPRIVIISGPSGSGKGTVIGSLPENFKKAVSVTTRSIRPGEREGVDYFFITHEMFDRMMVQNAILEYNYYDGNFYGTPRFQITDILASGNHAVLDVDVNGAVNIKEQYPEALMIFLMAPDVHVQEARIRGRGTNSEESIRSRIRQTQVELSYANRFDCVIVNEEGSAERTVRAILDAVGGVYPDPACTKEVLAHYFD